MAIDDLEGIADYIAQDNPIAAQKVISHLKSTISVLINYPEMGRPGRVHGTRELIVSNTPFVLPYRVVKTEIQILRILHGARKGR